MRLRPKTPLRPRPSKRAAPARLDPALRTPLYHQIYILLREQIMSGTYGDDALLPTELGRSYQRADLAKAPLLALLERAGVLIGSADQTITATLAGPEVATALEVQVGSALLAITRTVFDQNNRPVEHIMILYRPDRYA